MSTVTSPNVSAKSLATFDVATATAAGLEVSSKVTEDGLIQVVTFSDGKYYLHCRPGRPGVAFPRIFVLLDQAQLSALLDALKDAGDHGQAAGLDTPALQAFIAVLRQYAGADASNRFEQATLGAIVQDKLTGIIGYLGFGTDVAGSVHDKNGSITFEQHVVPLPPERYLPLSQADTNSLAAALIAYLDKTPAADPLWRRVLSDLQTQASQH